MAKKSAARTEFLKSVLPDSPQRDSEIAHVVATTPLGITNERPSDLAQKVQLANALADLTDGHAPLVKKILDDPHVSSLRDVAVRYDTEVLRSLATSAKAVSRKQETTPTDPTVAAASVRTSPSLDVESFQRRLFHAEPSAVLQRMVSDNQVSIDDVLNIAFICTF